MRLVRIALTDSHRDRARALSAARPVYAGSHRGAPANDVGALGEIVVLDHLTGGGLPVTHDDVTTHDLRLPTGATIDVKTKDRTVAPQLGYDCSVPLYNHEHQRPDYYVFVSLERQRDVPTGIDAFHAAYLCGAASQRQVERDAVTVEAGQTDPRNGTTFWTACRNLEIRQLVPIDAALDRWLTNAQAATLLR
jgi:hypothetical protein